MKNFVKNLKKVLVMSLSTAILALTFMPITVAKADTNPAFNFLDGDKELLRGVNVTQGSSNWTNPVSGNAGDTFAGIVYYHNGYLNTTATNTWVKINLPTSSTNKQIVVTAAIAADNASTITKTIVNGQVVGQNGLTVNLDQDSTVALVPGSVRWFPEANTRGIDTSVALPGGQNGDTITAQGVNIGAIQGCWNYAGFVTFEFKTTKLPSANITQAKIAKDLTTGQEGTDITTNPGDTVQYTLTTSNTGNAGTDYVVKDDISDVLELSDFVSASSGGTLSNGMISYPSANIAAGSNIVRTFTVKVKNPQPTNVQSGTHFDGIMQNIYGNWVYVRIQKSTPGQPNLTINKTVRNVTLGETSFVKEDQAKAGDTLEYQITFGNNGANADGVVISDQLPANVSYIAGSTSLTLNGKTTNPGDGLTTDGLTIGTLTKGQSGTIKFKVKIANGIATGEVLVNTGTIWYSKSSINSSATTRIVANPVPTQPGLPMTGPETPILSVMFASFGALALKYRKTLALLKRM